MSFILSVRAELQKRKGDWPRIAAETQNSYSWLCKFAQGTMTNPGAKRLEELEKYLREHPQTEAAHV